MAHVFNFEKKNAFGPAGEMFINHLYAFHATPHPQGEPVMPAEEFLRQWTVDDIDEMVTATAPTDMLLRHAAAADRPVPGRPLALGGMRRAGQAATRSGRCSGSRSTRWRAAAPSTFTDGTPGGRVGAKAFKFYNVRYDYGRPFPWRMDDPQVAFPVFEKAQELGVNLIGVHKGVPLGPQPIEATQTWDMDGAAANFPDINFVIFHVGLPFIDEVCWQLVRHPNLYASIAATINFVVRAPRQSAETLGKLLFWGGEDKIIYGSEARPCTPSGPSSSRDFQLPHDLVEGYGYPQLTEQAKRKILGENLLRLHGLDVEETARLRGA